MIKYWVIILSQSTRALTQNSNRFFVVADVKDNEFFFENLLDFF